MAWSGMATTFAFEFIKNQAVTLVDIAQAAIVFNTSVDKTSNQRRSGSCMDLVRCVFMRAALDLPNDTSAPHRVHRVLANSGGACAPCAVVNVTWFFEP